MKRFHEAVMAA